MANKMGYKSVQTRKAYAPPALIVYGGVEKLTAAGTSGTTEAPGNSINKKA